MRLTIRRPPPADVVPPRGALSPERAAVLENRGPLKILDIGCGRARGRQFLSNHGHTYLGLDIIGSEADVHADGHALPFAAAQFDAVLLFSVLQYTLDPLSLLREVRGVLRPNGTLTGCIAYLEPAVWGGLLHVSPLGLAELLDVTGFRLDYIWPSWSVTEAVSCAITQRPQDFSRSKTKVDETIELLDSCTTVFTGKLDYSAAINFHAVKAPGNKS